MEWTPLPGQDGLAARKLATAAAVHVTSTTDSRRFLYMDAAQLSKAAALLGFTLVPGSLAVNLAKAVKVADANLKAAIAVADSAKATVAAVGALT